MSSRLRCARTIDVDDGRDALLVGAKARRRARATDRAPAAACAPHPAEPCTCSISALISSGRLRPSCASRRSTVASTRSTARTSARPAAAGRALQQSSTSTRRSVFSIRASSRSCGAPIGASAAPRSPAARFADCRCAATTPRRIDTRSTAMSVTFAAAIACVMASTASALCSIGTSDRVGRERAPSRRDRWRSSSHRQQPASPEIASSSSPSISRTSSARYP